MKGPAMQTIAISCPACGATFSGPLTGRLITCEYCGTRYSLSKNEFEALGLADAGDADEVPADDYVDDGMAPMDEYASERCKAFLKRADQSSFASSGKILRGLAIPDGSEVYLIHDDTMFKTGKNGFAITNDGLYCREFAEKTINFVNWKGLAECEELTCEDCYIRVDGISVCYFTDDKELLEGKLLKLYRQLFHHAHKVL